jgi:uncharacterized protein (DUF2141 family)
MLLYATLAASSTFGQPALEVKILNVRKNSGKIIVELYNNESGWLKSPLRKTVLPTNEATAYCFIWGTSRQVCHLRLPGCQ